MSCSPRASGKLYALIVLLSGILLCFQTAGVSANSFNESEIAAFRAAAAEDYWELELKAPDVVYQALARGGRLSPETLRLALAQTKSNFLAEIDVEVLYDYAYLPLLLIRAPSNARAAAVRSHPGVADLHPPRIFQTSQDLVTATDTSAQIGAGTMRDLGFDGSGASVLITDTGIDINNIHPDFGICTAVGQPANTCRLATYMDLSVNGTDFEHGANVAGIVALTAPGARIHHVNIATARGLSGSAAMQGLSWAVQNQAVHNIVAHNMSWGDRLPYGPCEFYGSSFAVARVAGIAQISASGNDGLTNAISPPSCSSHVISVGNLVTADIAFRFPPPHDYYPLPRSDWEVASSSNVSAALDFLAPGTLITAGGIEAYEGTSMASPHVAGVFAILQAPAQWGGLFDFTLRDMIKSSGSLFLDDRVGIMFPVPDVYNARVLQLQIDNIAGVAYQLAPVAPKSCGPDCFNYPPRSLTVSYPSGYRLTGCAPISPTSCSLNLQYSRNLRLLRAEQFSAIVGAILSTATGAGDGIFSDDFEE